MNHRNFKSIFMILMPCLVGATSHALHAGEIEGAWELKSYELEGRNVEASGILVFSDGTFGMIYSMGASSQFGRAHAGTYEVESDRLTFDVELWIQRVEGSAGIVPGKVVQADLEWGDERLIIHFEGGSRQELEPLGIRETQLPAGNWKLENTNSRDFGKSVEGLLVVAGNRYVLLYVDKDVGAGKAYGGIGRKGGDLDPGWEISVDGASGTVAVGRALPNLELEMLEASARIRDAEGNSLVFSSQ